MHEEYESKVNRDRSLSAALLFCLWQILLTVALPFVFVRLWWRGHEDPRYRQHLGERLGLSEPCEQPIWLHAVSVGEAQAALRLVEAAQLPAEALLLTTTTPAGRATLQSGLPGAVIRYAPLDWWPAVSTFLRRHRPRSLILMETELWPGWLRACGARCIPVALANGRMAERSLRGYQRAGALGKEMFSHLDLCLCVAEDDAERFARLGVDRARLQVTGNVKFDASEHRADVPWLEDLGDWLVVAGSTHAGEEALILEAFAGACADGGDAAGLLLAPRHPHRAAECVALAREMGLRARLRSEGVSADGVDVVVLDTLGELAGTYGHGRVALIGGTWVPVGGHTPIEAALAGAPLITGPAHFKIAPLIEELRAAGALQAVADGEGLQAALAAHRGDEPARHAAGMAAASVAGRHRGAAERTVRALRALL